MKKLLLILSFVALFVGCAAIKTQVANFKACAKDETGQCISESVAKAKPIGETVGNVASLSGIPAAASVAKPVANYLALIYFMCIGGGVLLGKKSSPTSVSSTTPVK
jgi:hypothetical protein